MQLYFDSPRVWTPPPDQPLSQVLAAIQVPAHQSTIATWDEYLELLAQRVEWMIQQKADLTQACRMIHRYLNEAGMDHQIWNLPDPNEEPIDWATAITLANSELRMRMSMRSTWDFPLIAIESPEVLEIIRQTSLETWLQAMP